MASTYIDFYVWLPFLLMIYKSLNRNCRTSNLEAVTFVPSMNGVIIRGFADCGAFPVPALVGLFFSTWSIMGRSILIFQLCSNSIDIFISTTNIIAVSGVSGVDGVKVDDDIVRSSFMAFADCHTSEIFACEWFFWAPSILGMWRIFSGLIV